MQPHYILSVFASTFAFVAIAEADHVAPATSPRETISIPDADFQMCVALSRPFSLITTPEPPQPPDLPDPTKPPPPVSPDTPESPERPKSPETPETPKSPRVPETPEPPGFVLLTHSRLLLQEQTEETELRWSRTSVFSATSC